MVGSEQTRRHVCKRVTLAALVGLLVVSSLPCARAQDLFGIADPGSPFIFPPGLQGEARVTPIWMGIASGSNGIPSLGIDWSLINQFNMTRDYLFIDAMLRFGIGRFSVRGHYEPREFVGRTRFRNIPQMHTAEARLEYSGIRIGGDVDFFSFYGARVGANIDLDLYRPIFTEALQTDAGGKKIEGDSALTWGVHAMYAPVMSVYGVSGVFEVTARWPLLGTSVTDLELAGGLKGPESVLGSAALRFGWRSTNLDFHDKQLFQGVVVDTRFDAHLSGWFGQLVYYY
ncbi:MAG: hypothetical protein RDU20_12550 [Desulfomonilaceae bacterium]|nr:hypothetical protein [Desulfomonilaceae bacterium]